MSSSAAAACCEDIWQGNGTLPTPADMMRLNRDCRCWPIEAGAITAALPAHIGQTLDARHSHLFADTGVFVDQADLSAMTAQIAAIEAVAQLPGYQAMSTALTLPHSGSPLQAVMADPLAQRSTRGVFMGYDFHLSEQGPRLIEINTNAGGAFLVSHLEKTLGLPAALAATDGDEITIDSALVTMFADEWRLAGRDGTPTTIAIVEDHPQDQYLYSDMKLAVDVLGQGFANVVVVDRTDLRWQDGVLCLADSEIPVDIVYNRLTDFALTDEASASLAAAWSNDAVVVTPSPRHHALLANKLNLQLLSDAEKLRSLGLTAAQETALAQLPRTVRLEPENADALWEQRKSLFFKPAAGFGGRAAYRGAKLSRRLWQTIVAEADAQPYVAQTLVPPSQRMLADVGATSASALDRRLKFDVRVYSYAARPLMLAARVYEGQTTNFRTAGGGFAPVALLPGLRP